MLTESFFVFFCKGNQERTNTKLGEVEGIFYLNPIKILSSTAEEGSPRMTSRPHFSISLIVLALAKGVSSDLQIAQLK